LKLYPNDAAEILSRHCDGIKFFDLQNSSEEWNDGIMVSKGIDPFYVSIPEP